jgi:STE24 endopeptidase
VNVLTFSLSTQGIYEIDGSKRSSHSNAFFTGFGSNKRIALFDTLIKDHTIEQVVAVLAHEIGAQSIGFGFFFSPLISIADNRLCHLRHCFEIAGHYKKRHIIITMAISIANSALVLKLISLFISFAPLFEAFHISSPSIHIGLLLGSFMYSPISFFTSIAFNIISRKHEFEADRYSLEHYGEGSHLADGLRLLSKKNLVNLTPHPFFAFLTYSHPPMLQRLRAMEKSNAKKKL